jgi:hypothetical protein
VFRFLQWIRSTPHQHCTFLKNDFESVSNVDAQACEWIHCKEWKPMKEDFPPRVPSSADRFLIPSIYFTNVQSESMHCHRCRAISVFNQEKSSAAILLYSESRGLAQMLVLVHHVRSSMFISMCTRVAGGRNKSEPNRWSISARALVPPWTSEHRFPPFGHFTRPSSVCNVRLDLTIYSIA